MNKKITIMAILFLLLGMPFLFNQELFYEGKGFTPKNGFVPNEETAIKIAETIWFAIYGKNVRKKKPYIATLYDDRIWIVKGTLKKGRLGGVPYIEINKEDAKVLKVIHTK